MLEHTVRNFQRKTFLHHYILYHRIGRQTFGRDLYDLLVQLRIYITKQLLQSHARVVSYKYNDKLQYSSDSSHNTPCIIFYLRHPYIYQKYIICNTLFNDKFSLGVVRTKHAINLAKSGRIILPQKVATSFPARYYRVLSKHDLQLLSFCCLANRSLNLQC